LKFLSQFRIKFRIPQCSNFIIFWFLICFISNHHSCHIFGGFQLWQLIDP
jgi:hypothetical protein